MKRIAVLILAGGVFGITMPAVAQMTVSEKATIERMNAVADSIENDVRALAQQADGAGVLPVSASARYIELKETVDVLGDFTCLVQPRTPRECGFSGDPHAFVEQTCRRLAIPCAVPLAKVGGSESAASAPSAAVTYEGTGPDVITIRIPGGSGLLIADIQGNSDSRHFSVAALPASGEPVADGLLVNTTDPFAGSVPVSHRAVYLEVDTGSQRPWKIVLRRR